nr:interleukin 34 [Gasterosteus aculeatus]
MCTPLRTLNDSLSHRRRYMKHNFPINYTIKVHHKEILKLSDVNRMIIRVMPERHPSRPYTTELERRFKDVEGVFVQSHPAELIQNAAARLVFNLPKFSHTTPLLRSLHWLPVAARIQFKTLVLTYHAVNGSGPAYIQDMVFQKDLPETIQDTWDHLTEEPERVPESNWRFASPKALLDNLCHTMQCLFGECFAGAEAPQHHCVSQWRKGR